MMMNDNQFCGVGVRVQLDINRKLNCAIVYSCLQDYVILDSSLCQSDKLNLPSSLKIKKETAAMCLH